MIHHDQPVTVAIQRNTDIGPHARHGQLQQLRRHGPAAIVDIAAIGRAAHGHDLGTQVRQHPRAHLVGGAVGAVDHDLHARKIHAAGHRRGAEGLIVRAHLVHAHGPAQLPRLARHRTARQLRLDLLLELIRELAALVIKKLDAVVIVGIVRGADHDPEPAFELARQIGDAGSRQRPDEHHIHTGGHEARLQRRFKHVAGQARVLADEHLAPLRGEHPRRGAGQVQRKVHRHGMLPHASTHSVGTEILPRQNLHS